MTEPQSIIIVRSVWNDTDTPLAYFISFRSYGTWLHGDERGSIDRFNNRYKSPYIASNKNWLRHNQKELRAEPLILEAEHRGRIDAAIRETCDIRQWALLATNVRTNHIHMVVTSQKDPEIVLNAFRPMRPGSYVRVVFGLTLLVHGLTNEARKDYGMRRAWPALLIMS